MERCWIYAKGFRLHRASFLEREQFTMGNMENIYDSADNPLNVSTNNMILLCHSL